MIATPQAQAKSIHPLARFVTCEAIALLLNLEPEDIYRIDCWRYVIHVVGKGVSTFVSYADLPPILGVEPPSDRDLIYWRKRCLKRNKQAPKFWAKFYKHQFEQAISVAQLYQWGRLVSVIKLMISPVAVQELRNIYIQVKNSLPPYTNRVQAPKFVCEK